MRGLITYRATIGIVFSVCFFAHGAAGGEGEAPRVPRDSSWSFRIAASYLLRHPGAVTYDTTLPGDKWTYEQGLMLEAMRQMYIHTGREEYADFIRRNIDHFVDADGSIRTYRKEDYNLDMVAGGRALLFLYRRTKMEKYKTAADCLRRQLEQQPRTHAGGFWHKKIYPYQMWLDGLYMAEPFYARYAAMFDEPKAFDDIAAQFTLAYLHTLDPKTGLCYHGWDESRSQRWADSATGHSPCIWGRSMGWYLMGLVDVLDVFPADHPRRPELLKILRDLSAALLKYRDERSALWYQVVDRGGEDGNYLESSASSMFTYVFAKGARKGYLDRRFLRAARQSFDGIIKRFVRVDEQGFVNLTETCRGAGLGGDPYRDGSFAFYVGVPRATNDMKGIGACLLAAIQVESIPERTERQH